VAVVTPGLRTSLALTAYPAGLVLSRAAPVSARFVLSRFVLFVAAADDIRSSVVSPVSRISRTTLALPE
jgi:hypothetical protein